MLTNQQHVNDLNVGYLNKIHNSYLMMSQTVVIVISLLWIRFHLHFPTPLFLSLSFFSSVVFWFPARFHSHHFSRVNTTCLLQKEKYKYFLQYFTHEQ